MIKNNEENTQPIQSNASKDNAEPVAPAESSTAEPTATPKENFLLGLLGAVLGALIGGVAIILFDRLGFVASVSGFIMAYAALWLYQKFAKGLSTKGIIACIVIVILTTLLAENIACSIQIVEEFKSDYGITVSFGEIFGNLYKLIGEEVIDGGAYATSLVMVYAFTALGAFSVIRTSFSQRNKKK